MKRRDTLCWAALSCVGAASAGAQDTGGDPLGTLQWPDVRRSFLGAQAFEFDERILVRGPKFADDAMNVPVSVDASAYAGQIERIVVVVDRNPIRKVLDFEPLLMAPKLAFRFRLQQASGVRAMVKLKDGRWRVGSTFVQASGGGCTVPGASRADGSWVQTLGQVHAQVVRDFLGKGHARLRLRVMHPMDTGLVDGIPAYHLDMLWADDEQGVTQWRLHLFEPVSENPLLTFDFDRLPPPVLHIHGRDMAGLKIETQVRT